jgi:thiosulfate reductase cytochrome b subunit
MKRLALFLILTGVLLVLAGLAVLLAGRLPWLGRLPGDLHVRGRRFTFSFPLATCILLSVVITVVLNLILRLLKK